VRRAAAARRPAARADAAKRDAGGDVTATVARFPNYQRSDFFGALLPRDAIAGLLAHIEAWPGRGGTGHEGGVQLDALGAEVNRPDPSTTAFVHRRQRLHCAYLSFWGTADPPDRAAACEAWIRTTHATMRPWASGEAFQNYIDPELTNSGHAYYGANLARLRAVKRRYDPANRFAFEQGVAPAR